jgi:hypothetical protein
MMATKFPMNAARQAFRDCFKTAAAPNSAQRHRALQQHLQEQSQTRAEADCNAGMLQRAEHKDGCIA